MNSFERDEDMELEVSDYEIALRIFYDIHDCEPGNVPLVLAQWIATIRGQERAFCLAIKS